VKNIIIAICLAFLMVSIISCKKTDVQTNSLVGKWNIINDSIYIPIANIGGSNYIGTSDDYYNFTATGKVYINENSLLVNATYSMIANNQIDIVYSNGSYDPYFITNLTAHTATLTLAVPLTGPTKIINLRK
jgi:hypothetical protein